VYTCKPGVGRGGFEMNVEYFKLDKFVCRGGGGGRRDIQQNDIEQNGSLQSSTLHYAKWYLTEWHENVNEQNVIMQNGTKH
jgi:hypothetical protein